MKTDMCLQLKDAALDAYSNVGNLQKEIQDFRGEEYIPKYNFHEFYDSFRNRTDKNVYIDLVRKLDIECIENRRINANGKKIERLLAETTENRLPNKTEQEYLDALDGEYQLFLETMIMEEN